MDGFLGEIRLFALARAPNGWELCDGRNFSIRQNTALYSVIGDTYGGNGSTIFTLPDLRGRIPVGVGRGPGGDERRLGESGGQASVVLEAANLPPHRHTVKTAVGGGGGKGVKAGGAFAASGSVDLAPSLTPQGGGEHENLPPYQTLGFYICVNGLYPRRGEE